ncbi:AraC family transcriptional regulator [Streptacidiphilus sp. N1-10]|uniref:AraC family transcriptional regulator n=1 Tax=Streptacidiphilus jeojiensis TaxID=3229225 RepID=A0ABV6XEW1_9ACTN
MTQLTAEAPRPVEFSTVGLPEQRRIELWEGHNADALIGLRCRTIDAAVLEATELNLQLDRVHLARVRGTSHVVERDAEVIRRRPADAVALYFSLVGEAFFYHRDGVRVVRPGQLLICDADRPFLRGFSNGLEELVVKVPREVFAAVTGTGRPAEPVVVDFGSGGSPYARALARQVGRAARAVDPVAADERALLELVAALATGGRDGLSPAHLAAARAFIGIHLADPGLSAPQVAAAVGLSTRHLSRVFAGEGTTLPKYVLERRLEAAHAMLQRPGSSATTVAETAHACGFASADHFSRAFAARFGERATDLRRRAVAARAMAPDPTG